MNITPYNNYYSGRHEVLTSVSSSTSSRTLSRCCWSFLSPLVVGLAGEMLGSLGTEEERVSRVCSSLETPSLDLCCLLSPNLR